MKKEIINLLLVTIFTLSFFVLVTPVESAEKYHCICEKETPKCQAFDRVEVGPERCPNGCVGPEEGDCTGATTATPTPATPASGGGSCPTGYTCLTNPLSGNPTQVPEILGRVIKAAMGIIGSLALLMFVYGGFQWLISAGNAEKVKTGTQTMVWAAIGVILVFSSYLLLDTFIEYLTGLK
jgi:hypothetical protein